MFANPRRAGALSTKPEHFSVRAETFFGSVAKIILRLSPVNAVSMLLSQKPYTNKFE